MTPVPNILSAFHPVYLTGMPVCPAHSPALVPVHRDADHGQFLQGIFIFHFPSAQQTLSLEVQDGQGKVLAWEIGEMLFQGPQSPPITGAQWGVKLGPVLAGVAAVDQATVVAVQGRRPVAPLVPQGLARRDTMTMWLQGFAGAATLWTASCIATNLELST